MLQYTVVPPTLAADYFSTNDRLTRIHNDSLTNNISIGSMPRSPYISARQPSVPTSSSSIDDVLFTGDSVKVGGLLQGEPIRLVSIGSNPLPEEEQPAQEFEVVRRLGAGSYAVVYLVREVLYRPPPSDDGHNIPAVVGHMDIEDKYRKPSTVYGRKYAIKCLSKANLDQDALAAQMSEVTIHQSLRPHPNIVTLHRTLETSSFLLLLLEYVPGEDLFYFLEQARDHYDSDSSESSSSHTPPTPSLLSTLNPNQLLSRTRLRLISSMFSQMCDAVAACHDQQVFHRDIKPENFIVTDAWPTLPDGTSERKVVVKLTDFGLSTTDIESSDMDCGSAPYMSYECRNNIAPTYHPRAADVWSLGIVLINMLYHCNPWTDTAQDACPSFSAYRLTPVAFFMQRFGGMTQPVAQFLANRVFNILDGDGRDDSKRISAKDFGDWSKALPDLLCPPVPPLPLSAPVHHRRHTSVSSITGHPICSSVPPSHRPSSRQATPIIQPRILAGLPVSRPPSIGPALVPSLSPAFSTVTDQDLLVEEPEEEMEHDNDENTPEGMTSRSTSTNKRRKRGARKGKGSTTPLATSDEALDTLAVASQSLARELSRASKSSSKHTESIKSGKSGRSTESSRSKNGSFEPPSMYGIPSALLHASGPAVLPPVPPLPALIPASTITTSSVPAPVTKKPSKWKLSFGKANAANVAANIGRVSPVDETPPATKDVGTSTQSSMSSTATNVTTLIMGLNAPPHSAPPPSIASAGTELTSSWSRGRSAQRSPIPTSSANGAENRNNSRVPSTGRSINTKSSPSPSRTNAFGSSSPHLSAERGRERGRWIPNHVDNGDRAISPSSARAGRHSQLASSASSLASGVGSSSGSSNWRNSTSSAGTSTSAFTHYSNSSLRSVSTNATSISSNSWRNGTKSPNSPTSPIYTHPAGVPKNIKREYHWSFPSKWSDLSSPVMDGVPWELGQTPRGQHPNNPDFGKPQQQRKARTRKPKDLKLEPITELTAKKTPEFLRQDASTSTTDLSGSRNSAGGNDDGELGNKKIHPRQINTLAKILLGLRR